MNFHLDEYTVVVGIDPGTDTVGYSCGLLHNETGHLRVCSAITLQGAKLLKKVSDDLMAPRYGNMVSRLLLLGEEVKRLLESDAADICIIEDFYLGRNVSTYGTLVRAQQTFLCAAYMAVPLCTIKLIKPAIGKIAFGVPSTSSNKDLMQIACRTLPDTTYDEGVLDDITEHSADAMAQLFAYVKSYRELHGLTK